MLECDVKRWSVVVSGREGLSGLKRCCEWLRVVESDVEWWRQVRGGAEWGRE